MSTPTDPIHGAHAGELPEARPTAFSRVALAVPMRMTEANFSGNVHGGEVVKQADSCAGASARRHSGGSIVTAYIDDIVFREPVRVGDILHTASQVNWVGRSSMEVGVRIEAEPFGGTDGRRHVATAYFLMVAVDADGRPRPVPRLELDNDDDRRRWREAEIRRTHRLARRDAIDEVRRSS